jgi:hypothetical protein
MFPVESQRDETAAGLGHLGAPYRRRMHFRRRASLDYRDAIDLDSQCHNDRGPVVSDPGQEWSTSIEVSEG